MKTNLSALALALGLAVLPAQASAQANKQSNSTAAETTIKPNEGDLTLADVLRRKAPGLQIQRDNDGSYEIYIRGAAQDASGAPPPLMIVDGMPIDDINQELQSLDPRMIDKVQVIRDVASTSMYGTRAAGGVIIITTKHR